LIEPLRIAGDVGKFPLLRVHIEAGFRVRKPDPGKVNHRIDILEMIQQQVELPQIDVVDRTQTFPRLGCVQRRNRVTMREQLPDYVTSQTSGTSGDNDPHV
jgi:hypothetical protein